MSRSKPRRRKNKRQRRCPGAGPKSRKRTTVSARKSPPARKAAKPASLRKPKRRSVHPERASTTGSRSETADSEAAGPSRKELWLAAVVVVAGIIVYWNSFSGVFLFDDFRNIVDNQAIRRLWPVWAHLSGSFRPLVDLSVAINYSVGKLDVWGYHAFYLAIHLLAALVLFGVVRRTLMLERLRSSFGRSAQWLALAVSLIWVVHPLHTEAVTYIIHRAEAMMGLCYLLTLYCMIRGVESPRRRWRWYATAAVASAAGMGCKEVVATAPVVVLLYDRVFLSRSFRELFRQRWGLYAMLAASWLVLVATGLVEEAVSPHPTRGAAGLGYAGFGPKQYLLTQPGVILHYLKLSFWPHPLCVDYGWPVAKTLGEVFVPVIVVLTLLIATGWALWRRGQLGFLGAWFFVILAPTSSFIPIQDPACDRRMYLPLAALVVLAVLGGYRGWRQLGSRLSWSRRTQTVVVVVLPLTIAGLLGYGTITRNRDYHSAVAMWCSVVATAPNNARGYNGLGVALRKQGQVAEAVRYHQKAISIDPNYARAHTNLAIALAEQGSSDQAIEHYTRALQSKPKSAKAHYNLARLLRSQGKTDQAIVHYEKALELDPNYAYAHTNLGIILAERGSLDDAVDHYRRALRVNPDLVQAHFQLGKAWLAKQNYSLAIEQFNEVLRLDPENAETHMNLGIAYQQREALDDALRHYSKAVQLNPKHYKALNNLGNVYLAKGKYAQAIEKFNAALRIKPNFATPRYNLGRAFRRQGKIHEAIAVYREVLRINPNHVNSRKALNRALAELEQPVEPTR